MYVHAQSLSRVQLFETPWTVAYQAPLSIGILQARILEWVAMPSSRASSRPRHQPKSPASPALADRFLSHLPGQINWLQSSFHSFHLYQETKTPVTCFVATFAFLWSGTKPVVSPRCACTDFLLGLFSLLPPSPLHTTLQPVFSPY